MSSRLHKSVRSAVSIMGIGLCAATAQAAQPGDVLISRVASPNTTSGFVELYNASASYIALNGWVVDIAKRDGTTGSTNTLPDLGIAPRGRVFLVTTAFKTANPAALVSSTIGNHWSGTSPFSGQLRLRDASGLSIDELRFGSPTTIIYGEGDLAPALTSTTTLSRITNAQGLRDTNDNSVDFELIPGVTSAIAAFDIRNSAAPGSPIAYNGKVYVGGGDGKFWTLDTASLAPHGASINIKLVAVADTIPVISRPSLRNVQGNLSLFLTTSNGALIRIPINADGTMNSTTTAACWPMPSNTSTDPVMPAVFPADDGLLGFREYVFVTMSDSQGAILFKIPALDFTKGPISLSFGSGTVAASSPSVNGPSLYVGMRHPTTINDRVGLQRVNPNTLDVLTNLAYQNRVSGSPMVSHTAASGFFQNLPVMYIATDEGNVYARNADTGGTILASFGENGRLALDPSTRLSNVYLHDNVLYVSAYQKPIVYAVNAQTGAGAGLNGSTVFFDGSAIPGMISNLGIRGGVVVDPNGTVCFGTSWGWFYQIPIAHPDQPVIYKLNATPSTSGFYGTPTIDTVNGYVLAVNSNGYLYRLPRY